MTITASQVKDLRERTGLGMMECKAALTETGGDIDMAIDLLRKKVGAKVEKKAHRTAAEGAVAIHIDASGRTAALVEVNSETDFVAKDERFMQYALAVAKTAAVHDPHDVAALSVLTIEGGNASVGQERNDLVSKFGENINIRRFSRYVTTGRVGHYLHGRRIGVLIELTGADETLARDLAMHIAASRPAYVARQDVPEDVLAKEREIFLAQGAESGKPREIMEKMVAGKIAKFISEITLLGQAFVKDPDTTIEKLLERAGAKVVRFVRYEVGEGIERSATDFASEVMAQVKGA
ncbi:MAG: translation elongation factor Ts [Acidiferrobacteraceae bacterium]